MYICVCVCGKNGPSEIIRQNWLVGKSFFLPRPIRMGSAVGLHQGAPIEPRAPMKTGKAGNDVYPLVMT